jgi:DNA-directed RNA polymerase specialized sigma24 family protein
MPTIPGYVFVEVLFDPYELDLLDESLRLGYESPDEVEAKLAERERIQPLIDEVKRRMQTELTGRQRDCITLRYLEGLSEERVGKALNIHRSTAREHIRAGMAKLRSCFLRNPS